MKKLDSFLSQAIQDRQQLSRLGGGDDHDVPDVPTEPNRDTKPKPITSRRPW